MIRLEVQVTCNNPVHNKLYLCKEVLHFRSKKVMFQDLLRVQLHKACYHYGYSSAVIAST